MSVNYQRIDFQFPQCGSILKRILMSDNYCRECDREYSEGELRKNYST